MKGFPEAKENENTTYQKVWNTEKAAQWQKYIAMSTYIKRTKRSQISDLMQHLKPLEQQEIIKIRAKINKIDTKKNIHRTNER
jgi:hypothetical protein